MTTNYWIKGTNTLVDVEIKLNCYWKVLNGSKETV